MTKQEEETIRLAKELAAMVCTNFGCIDPVENHCGGPDYGCDDEECDDHPTEAHNGDWSSCFYCQAQHTLVVLNEQFPEIVAPEGGVIEFE